MQVRQWLSPAGEDYRPVRCLDGHDEDMEDVGSGGGGCLRNV